MTLQEKIAALKKKSQPELNNGYNFMTEQEYGYNRALDEAISVLNSTPVLTEEEADKRAVEFAEWSRKSYAFNHQKGVWQNVYSYDEIKSEQLLAIFKNKKK